MKVDQRALKNMFLLHAVFEQFPKCNKVGLYSQLMVDNGTLSCVNFRPTGLGGFRRCFSISISQHSLNINTKNYQRILSQNQFVAFVVYQTTFLDSRCQPTPCDHMQ